MMPPPENETLIEALERAARGLERIRASLQPTPPRQPPVKLVVDNTRKAAH
jgi:hypothetical protein